MRIARISLIAAASVLLPLAACHKTPEAAPEPDNNLVEEEPAAADNNMADETPTPENNMMEEAPKPKKPPVKPWPKVSADQQMLDDADATGMTARVSRDGGGSNAQ
jgi:outer membrane biosynthesis protein TonB